MIYLGSKARLTCDTLGCDARADADLVLCAGGSFVAKAPGAWQLLARSPFEPLISKCPAHRTDLLVNTDTEGA